MPQAKNVTIKGETFSVSQPYEAGHALTEAEARALNQMRSENIRNNMAKTVETAMASGGAVEGKPIADIVAAYDADYSFAMPGQSTARVTDPVEREARSIARDALRLKLAEETPPRKLKDVDQAKLEAAIEQVIQEPEVQKLAKQRVKQKQSVSAELLAGLELGA